MEGGIGTYKYAKRRRMEIFMKTKRERLKVVSEQSGGK